MTAPPGPALGVAGVRAGYRRQVDVLRDVSLTVDVGEAVALVGANGAGKTTLLRVISGLLRAREGRIALGGADVSGLAPHRIAQGGLAHVPEGRQIFVHQSVHDNLRLGAMGSPDCEARLAETLDVFPALAPKLHQRAGELSGGQQQMLAIGRGLMSRPALLMLDEPSLGLSPKLVDEVIELLRRVREERRVSLLLVEQNTAIAAAVADRAYVLQRGAVVLEERAEDLLANRDLLRAYLT